MFNSQKLIDLRWSKKMKQCELAAKVGVKPTVVCNWENGKHSPSSMLLMKLSSALDVEPGYFFE